MLDRELTYRVPFERLMKLSRSMGRGAFDPIWWATWVWKRDALVREIFRNPGPDAKDRSIAHVRPLLASSGEKG